jgi:hypothetical protein
VGEFLATNNGPWAEACTLGLVGMLCWRGSWLASVISVFERQKNRSQWKNEREPDRTNNRPKICDFRVGATAKAAKQIALYPLGATPYIRRNGKKQIQQ